MANKVRIKVEARSEPNLRKLARAFIALARQQLDAEVAVKPERRREKRGSP